MVSRAPQHFDDPSYAPAAHLPLSKGANQLIPVVRRDQIPYTHSLFALTGSAAARNIRSTSGRRISFPGLGLMPKRPSSYPGLHAAIH